MSHYKNTIFFSEIEFFFKKAADNAILAMISAVKAIRLTGIIPTLKTMCNAQMKTTKKLTVLLLLPFYGCKDSSHLPHSATADWFSARYNILYRLLRDTTVDWRKVFRLSAAEGRGHCLMADDTDIAKSGMRMVSFVRVYEIYAMRRSIEVCFKESKQYLHLEGSQDQYFNSLVAYA